MKALDIFLVIIATVFFGILFFAPVWWCKPLDRFLKKLGNYLPRWLVLFLWYDVIALLTIVLLFLLILALY